MTPTETAPFEQQTEARPNWVQRHPVLLTGLVSVAGLLIFLVVAYVRFSRTVEARLQREPQGNVAVYYAAPRLLHRGDSISAAEIANAFRRADSCYTVLDLGDAAEIRPGAGSAGPVRVALRDGRIARMVSLPNQVVLTEYALPAQPFANLQGQNREARANLRFDEIPPNLIHAILSAEDKHFFQHAGFDPGRIAKAIYVNWKSGKKEQGGSTLTMQLARNLWLDREKTWRRKSMESLITVVLEQKLTKKQIMEMYCSKIYLGRHANYSIYGFGPAARAYFDKDIRDLTLPEAALLAGMAQRPTYFDPIRNPTHALARRDLVLELMRQNGYVTPAAFESATAAPLALKPHSVDASNAPYFLSLASDEAQSSLGTDSAEFAGARIYTTLDEGLQSDAREAVEQGIKTVDAEIAAKRRKNADGAMPQVALIALDPKTGEVKAVVGGRDYAESQLNHAQSRRQPGSVFKPFVYAAALQGAISGFGELMTPSTTVNDAPTTFQFGRQRYTPGNFGQKFYGTVTLRQALAHSMNVATIKVAEKIGYQRVVSLAQSAGLNDDIKPTPAVALGAYEATPMEIAGAYTVFANHGVYVKPVFLERVQTPDRGLSAMPDRAAHQVLDQRVAFLMVDMLQEVVRSGTAARVRAMGLKEPVAGKTGTSRDGWFAGFSSGLLCVVWVGYDDNRELNLEGAKSAMPIWVEFMKRALARYPGDAHAFAGPPTGVASVAIDPATGQLAGPSCPTRVKDFFVEGTEPGDICKLHNGDPDAPAEEVSGGGSTEAAAELAPVPPPRMER